MGKRVIANSNVNIWAAPLPPKFEFHLKLKLIPLAFHFNFISAKFVYAAQFYIGKNHLLQCPLLHLHSHLPLFILSSTAPENPSISRRRGFCVNPQTNLSKVPRSRTFAFFFLYFFKVQLHWPFFAGKWCHWIWLVAKSLFPTVEMRLNIVLFWGFLVILGYESNLLVRAWLFELSSCCLFDLLEVYFVN